MTIIPLITQCRKATNNGDAAILLYRILYWMPRAKVTHGGHRCIANSAEQWCEQTGLTYDQYRRSIALLRKLGLVETEQHLFFGKNVTHVRTTSLADALRTGASLGSGQIAQVHSYKIAPSKSSGNAQLIIQGVSNLESLQGETTIAFASAHADLGNPKQQVDTGKKKLNNISTLHNVAVDVPNTSLDLKGTKKKSTSFPSGGHGVTSQHTGPTTHAKAENECTVSLGSTEPASDETTCLHVPPKNKDGNIEELAEIWVTVIQQVYNEYVPPFDKKRLKQLSDFRDLCPQGEAEATIEVCLRNWDDFTHHCKHFYAAWPIPTRPTLNFLLKYIEGAANFAQQLAKKNTPPLPYESKPKKVIVPELSTEQLKAQYYEKLKKNNATADEMEAILNGDIY